MKREKTKSIDKQSNKNKCSGGGNFSCRHPKLWSYIKSNVKAFFITGAIVFTISASATTVKILHSRQVRYKNDKSVETAINELYQKADELHLKDKKEMKKIGCNGCTKLEYLESTGTQYIDTGTKVPFIIDIKAKYSSFNSSYPAVPLPALFGSQNLTPSYQSTLIRANNNGRFKVYCLGKVVNNSFYRDLNVHTYKLSCFSDSIKFYFDNSLENSINATSSLINYNVYLFALNNGGSPFQMMYGRIYYVKIYSDVSGENLVRDYIPVLDSNNRPCLFDKVSKTCFYNQGTGEFLYG